MRKMKLLAGIVLSVITFTSVGAVKAEEGTVTEKFSIEMAFENEVGEKKIADEDAKVINEAFGYGFGDNTVMLCSEDTWMYIDWEKSMYTEENVYFTTLISPVLHRNENDNLIVEKDENGGIKDIFYDRGVAWRGYWGPNNKYENQIGDEGSFFDIHAKEKYHDSEWSQSINPHMGETSFLMIDDRGFVQKPITDVYIVRVCYITNGMSGEDYWFHSEKREEMTFGYMDFWILPEGVSTVLKLEDVNEPDDNKPSDTYTLDLSSDNAVVSSETFNTLLEENKTKDVVIKSNNNVTFTFAKGTMKPVEGKDSYDFSATINSAYNTDLPSYVTSSNFVSQINYNYSGKLPAETSIRFYAVRQDFVLLSVK